MTEEYKTKEKEIIDHYGIEHQLKKLAEEFFELIEANYSVKSSTDHVREELADCMVLLAQIQLKYGFSNEEIEKIMEEKIDRQKFRIEQETLGWWKSDGE